jgi:NAD(P)-dependent dehydrogenase (short-subunit alcohol dehydrogenase family)
MTMDLQLAGKSALVSGSERGTGQVIATALASEGAQVVFHANAEDARPVAGQLPPGCHSVWGDLTTDAGAEQAIAMTEDCVGPVDILVNNYGTASSGRWKNCSEADWLDMYQRNVLSAARLSRLVIEGMKTKGWGRIVQLGTIGSHQPGNIMPHYYTAKGALATMGVSLARELGGTGVTVNTVSPGLIRTPEVEAGYLARGKQQGWGDSWEEVLPRLVENDFPNPCGRIAEREEVADLVAFLCSPRAGFINGQNIRIDGGAVAYV